MFEAPATECEEEALYDAQDRLRSYDGVDYSYTDRGTLFQRDDGETLETFTYDALGNLTQVERNTEPTIHYVIDALGRRVGKKVGGSVDKQYAWSSQLRIAAELNGSGEVVSRFLYGHSPNSPAIALRKTTGQSDRIYRVITDHLGSPVYIVNIGNPSDVWLDASYDAWGNVTSFQLDGVDQGTDTSAWPIPHGFAGGLFDSDTGLVRFGARDYDPRIGRWTAKDPIFFEGGQANLYVYVGNEPSNRTDPQGLWYVDFNFGFGFGSTGNGLTGGFIVSSEGLHAYAGGGPMMPGFGWAVTYSQQDVTTGLNFGAQGSLGPAAQVGTDAAGVPFYEVGFGSLGASATGYWISEPIIKWGSENSAKCQK